MPRLNIHMTFPTHLNGIATVKMDEHSPRLWRVHVLWDMERVPFRYYNPFVAKALAEEWVDAQDNLTLETNEYFDRIVRNFATLPSV